MENNKIKVINNNIFFLKDDENVAKLTTDIDGNININSSRVRKDLNSTECNDLIHKQYLDNVLNIHSNSNNPHNITKFKIGLSNVENLKNNLIATRDPTSDDNLSEGYQAGSRWINRLTFDEFVCVGSTESSSFWQTTTTSSVDIIKDSIIISSKTWSSQKIKTELDRLTPNEHTHTYDEIINLLNVNLNNFDGILSVSKGGTGKAIFPNNKFLQGGGEDGILATKTVPIGDVVGASDDQELSNKTINANINTILNISDFNIKSLAGINVTKVGDGSVNNLKFSFINSLRSDAQKQMDSHFNNINNPHNITKEQIGLSNVNNIKNNYSATINPNNIHDVLFGYTVGSRWINTINKKEFICVNNSENNAVWIETTQPSGEINTLSNLGTGEGISSLKFGSDLRIKSLKEGNNIVMTSNSSEINIQAKNTHNFILSNVPIGAYTTYYKSPITFAWKNSEYSSYTNGRVIFEAETVNRGLDIRVYDITNNASLGNHTTITHSGYYSFSISNPGTDARIEFQIKKDSDGGVDPRIYGLAVRYNS
jgi:hypothetical protein